MNQRHLLCLSLALPLLACRPDIGDPNYAQFLGDDDDSAGTTDPNDFPGPDPYEDGEERLSIGIFYEGGYSSLIPLEAGAADYFIYDGTYDSFPDFDAREEGYQSDVIAPSGIGWWGGGVSWTPSIDLSSWTQMHVSFAADAPEFASFDIGFGGGSGSEVRVNVANYGFVNDGEWHQVVVPLADFVAGGADLSSVGLSFQLIAEGLVSGPQLRVDNLYFTKETAE
ncbi:MAG: hypothetical protein KDA24_07760 [Deltaproteobacteria bacterium]|nr:hypothetical protein [Deltaproteobacteria bacterium]